MVSLSAEVLEQAPKAVEVPQDFALDRLAELAQAYILDGPEAFEEADLYMANKALSKHISNALEHGLTPRDLVLSLLRPGLATRGHCRCPSCQERCTVCRRSAGRHSNKTTP